MVVKKDLRLIGFEPITYETEIHHSIQLSYKRMIQEQTILKVADNSGAKTAKCIKVLKGFRSKTARVGDLVIAVIQKLRNKSKKTSKVKKKEIYKALVVRTKTKLKRVDGSSIMFFNNSIILIDKQNGLVGTRILGPSPKSIKNVYNLKLSSLVHSV